MCDTSVTEGGGLKLVKNSVMYFMDGPYAILTVVV